MNSPPSSLRDFYATSSNTSGWSFVPPPLPAGSPSVSENSTSFYPPSSSASSSSYQWSTRTSPNPLFDLSASYDDDTGVDITLLLKGVAGAAFVQYVTRAIVMPWEVGRILLQVQWVPRDAGEPPADAVLTTDAVDEDEELSDSSNDHDAYFADPTKLDSDAPSRAPRLADERGYVVRQSVLEEGTLPEYVMPVGRANGVWGIIKQLSRFRSEGWISLWKGLLTKTVYDALLTALQPVCQSIIQTVLASVFPSPVLSTGSSSLLLPVASRTLAGFLVSPLDLILTRLIVQSSHPRYRTYTGPLDALQQIVTYEGGIRGIYLHPHLLIPTLLDCSLRALIPLAMPGLIVSYMTFGAQVTPETHPVLWALAELIGDLAGFLITLPIETVRHRLQAQVRGSAKPLRPCVELRPAPYNGVVDALWHIITEERSDLPVRTKSRQAKAKGKAKGGAGDDSEDTGSWLQNTGIGQLYRGLGIRVTAGLIMFVLGLLGQEEPDSGWAEL